jgi:hypothetical protein
VLEFVVVVDNVLVAVVVTLVVFEFVVVVVNVLVAVVVFWLCLYLWL